MMNWISSRLSIKMTLIIAVLTFAAVGSACLLLYQRSIISLEKEAYGRLEEMVGAYGNQMDIQITNTMQITDTLRPLIQKDFSVERAKSEPGYIDSQLRHFEPYVRVLAEEFSLAKTAYIYYNWQLDGQAHDVYYADPDGDGVVNRQNTLPVSYFTEEGPAPDSKAWWFGPVQSRKGFWSPPYEWVSDDGTVSVFLSYTRAVYEDETLIGVVGTDFKYQDLLEVMRTIKVYDTGYPFLLDGNKHFLVHPQQAGNSLAQLTQEPFKTLREEIPFKSEGAFRFTEKDGKAWFVTYHRLRNDWILGMTVPVKEVTQGAGSLAFFSIGIAGGFGLLICLAVYMTVRQITVPLREMTSAVSEMTAGEYLPVLNPGLLKRKDEMGGLARSLRHLGRTLDEGRYDDQHQEEKSSEHA